MALKTAKFVDDIGQKALECSKYIFWGINSFTKLKEINKKSDFSYLERRTLFCYIRQLTRLFTPEKLRTWGAEIRY